MITKINMKERSVKSYAMRKLAMKECLRLVGVRDGAISRMQQKNEDGKMIVSSFSGTCRTREALASLQYGTLGVWPMPS